MVLVTSEAVHVLVTMLTHLWSLSWPTSSRNVCYQSIDHVLQQAQAERSGIGSAYHGMSCHDLEIVIMMHDHNVCVMTRHIH